MGGVGRDSQPRKFRIFKDVFGNYVVRTPDFEFVYPYPVGLKFDRQKDEPLKHWQVLFCLNFVHTPNAIGYFPGHDQWLLDKIASQS